MKPVNPILAEVTRGQRIESLHRGACAVVDAAGTTLQAWGVVAASVFPRSALKPLQALPLVETGAADALDVGTEELALACASHNGEAGHVERVRAWLGRMGLGENDLACGPQDSLEPEVTKARVAEGVTPGRAHNNCSGKHAGFLATALHMGESIDGYVNGGHPVQQRIARAVHDLTGADLHAGPCGVDGCGIPACALPLDALARGMARLTSGDLPAGRQMAATRILDAMAAHPDLVAGQGRIDTVLMKATRGTVISKIGAEGVHIAIARERGLGVALKIDDGARRAADVAMLWVLDGLGVLDDTARRALTEWAVQPIHNSLGAHVGEVRPGAALKF